MNELSHGQRINFPTSFVRSVSFQKIRQGSLSSRTSKQQSTQPFASQAQPTTLCQRLLSQKLNRNNNNTSTPLQSSSSHQNRANMIKKQLQQQQLKQCTFKPQINKNSNAYPNRTIEQFVDQQMVYEKYKENKLNEMREIIKAKIDKENTFTPNIGVKEGAKKNSKQVYDRLYDEYQKRQQINQQNPSSQSRQKTQKQTSTNKIIPFSRKNSQKSIIGSSQSKNSNSSKNNTNHSKNHQIVLGYPHDSAEFYSNAHLQMQDFNAKNSQAKRDMSREASKEMSRGSRNSSRSHKGLKITKYMDVQEVCEKKLSQKPISENKPQNQKNKELVVRKTLRQLSCILSQLSIQTSQNPSLTYLQMSQILQKMNFLEKSAQSTGTNSLNNDRKYSYHIWQMLQGDIYQSCPLANFIRIVFCLLGVHDVAVVESALAVFLGDSASDRKLVIMEKESKQIKSNFEQLCLNRLRYGEYSPQVQQSGPTFKPYISKNSQQMAQNYRQKILQQSQQLLNKNLIDYSIKQNGQVNHIDLLFLDQKCKELKLKNRRQELDRDRKRAEDQAMMPDRKFRDSRNQLPREGEDRCKQLYELGKNTLRSKKQKSEQQSQISKQCTFQPNKNKSNTSSHQSQFPNQSTSIQEVQIPNFEKQIFRMYQARHLRQSSTNMNSYPHSSTSRTHQSSLQTDYHTNSHIQSQSHLEDTPCLYLNVCMEGADDIRVPVFEGDTIKSIVYKVKVLIGIDDDHQGKLEEIIRRQVQHMIGDGDRK